MHSCTSLEEHCQYKDTLKEMLQCFLAEKGLTYEKALELALVIESAEKYTKNVKIANGKPFQKKMFISSTPILYPAKGRKRFSLQRKLCVIGMEENILAPDCKFKSTECHICKKKLDIL